MGRRGNPDGPPATGIRTSVSTGSCAPTGYPFRRPRNGAAARTCHVIPRHRVKDRSRIAIFKKLPLDTTPEFDANSAISLRGAKAAGPARQNVSRLSGTNQTVHTHLTGQLPPPPASRLNTVPCGARNRGRHCSPAPQCTKPVVAATAMHGQPYHQMYTHRL